jgi:hypothetical protein
MQNSLPFKYSQENFLNSLAFWPLGTPLKKDKRSCPATCVPRRLTVVRAGMPPPCGCNFWQQTYFFLGISPGVYTQGEPERTVCVCVCVCEAQNGLDQLPWPVYGLQQVRFG